MAGELTLAPIGFVRGGFRQKFGTPRQPGLAPHSHARVELQPPYDQAAALRGLETASHVWLLFGFHHNPPGRWRPTVRPPRLGGNRRLGVFASRSPFRPNPLGQSVVELLAVDTGGAWTGLSIAGHDLVDGTPVYDIRPYIPYADSIPGARAPLGFECAPTRLAVSFEPAVRALADRLAARDRALIEEVLALDPRPAYRAGDESRRYVVSVAGYEVTWRVAGDTVRVEAMAPAGPADGATQRSRGGSSGD